MNDFIYLLIISDGLKGRSSGCAKLNDFRVNVILSFSQLLTNRAWNGKDGCWH